MTKKPTKRQEYEAQRQSRKEVLIARKEAKQTRQIRLAIGLVITLLVVVILVGVVNELIISPNRPVAVVNGEEVALRDWENRVRYERANRVMILDNQLQAFGGDVGIIQRFGGQLINELQDSEGLAQDVLNQMMDEVAIRQAAEARGIIVTDEDVQSDIGSSFNFYNGESPTVTPTATQTAVPTPSLTPLPTPVITDVVPTSTPAPTRTLGPTLTPAPLPTPVSADSFKEQYDNFITQLNDLGVTEETFRSVVRARIYSDRLMESLAEENELPTEAEQVSFYLISFDSEADANEAAAMIRQNGFIETWNSFKSLPAAPESTATATEILWRPQEDIVSGFGQALADIAFSLPPNVPSSPIVQTVDAETSRYHILQVSGREVRPLSDSTIQNNKLQLLTNFVDQQLAGNSSQNELWRSRVPTQPILNPIFLAPPTPAPIQPTVAVPTVPGN